jgi:hypothetical protein
MCVLSAVRRAEVGRRRAVLCMCVAGSCPEIDCTPPGGGRATNVSTGGTQAAAHSVSCVLLLVWPRDRGRRGAGPNEPVRAVRGHDARGTCGRRMSTAPHVLGGRRSESSAPQFAAPLTSIGFSDFFGTGELTWFDTQSACQGSNRARGWRRTTAFETRDCQRVHAGAARELGLGKEVLQPQATERLAECHQALTLTILEYRLASTCKLIVAERLVEC